MHRALDRCTARIDDAKTVRPYFGAVAVLEVDHPARHRQHGRDVRCREVLAFAEPEQERRTAPRDDHGVGIARRNHGERKGALQLGDGAHARREERIGRLAVFGDEVGDHLGVGLGDEFIARALEPLADRFIVLDDAVVHDGQVA